MPVLKPGFVVGHKGVCPQFMGEKLGFRVLPVFFFLVFPSLNIFLSLDSSIKSFFRDICLCLELLQQCEN